MIWAVIKGDVIASIGWFFLYIAVAAIVEYAKLRRAKRARGRQRGFDGSYRAWQMRARLEKKRRRR